MLDYTGLLTLMQIVREGSFERAAEKLHITPSAVSQRLKALEETMGTILVERGQPCLATESGARLCRHLENVLLLEQQLGHGQTLDKDAQSHQHIPVSLAANADSLATWLMKPLAIYGANHPHLLHISVDDQDHTADWLAKGKVLAAVTVMKKPIQGCQSHFLGILRYHATASPNFVKKYFSNGINAQAMRHAPSLIFNNKDRLQDMWYQQTIGGKANFPRHYLPSSHGFLQACLDGMGWGMNPALLAAPYLADGRLIELLPEKVIDIPLYWQINRLSQKVLSGLTDCILQSARMSLLGAGSSGGQHGHGTIRQVT